MSEYFRAPRSLLLKIVTVAASVLLLGLPLFFALFSPEMNWLERAVVLVLPPLIWLATLFFMIRGYEVRDEAIRVERLGWWTTIRMEDVQSARFEPGATKGSIRLFGIGGVFCFCGWFWNKKLGTYRGYITDPKNAVLLESAKGRPIVVTRERPEEFAALVNSKIPAQK